MTGIFTLVVLRVGIGMHFYSEGIKKVRDPSPYSASFLANAKGRFAHQFQGFIWDRDGLARFDGEQARARFDQYRERAIKEYGLNEAQREQAQQIFDRHWGQLDTWLKLNAPDIEEYKQGLARRERYFAEPDRVQVASLRGQLSKLEAELGSKRRELTGPIDQIWSGYVDELYELGGRPAGGPLTLTKPGRRWIDSESIDVVIRYFDVVIGVLLVLGLFTRTASFLGALFLCSVIVSQWPGSPGAVPVWSQFVEMLGMLVLAANNASRFAGLDFLTSAMCRWCCPPKSRGTNS